MPGSRGISLRNTSARSRSTARGPDAAPAFRRGRLDRFFALGVAGLLVFVADILAGAVAYQEQWVDRWFFPGWIASQQDGIRTGATIALLIFTGLTLAAEWRAARRSLPRILYIVGIAIMVGLALQPRSLFLFLVVWTSQHWILATGLASQVPTAEMAPKHGFLRRLLHRLNIRPWAVVLLLMIISVMLLPIFEVEANRQAGTYYGDRIFGAIGAALRESSWVPVLVALGFATGFTHYLLDRSVFRMSDPKCARPHRVCLRAQTDRMRPKAYRVSITVRAK
jgi:hypothetical protein